MVQSFRVHSSPGKFLDFNSLKSPFMKSSVQGSWDIHTGYCLDFNLDFFFSLKILYLWKIWFILIRKTLETRVDPYIKKKREMRCEERLVNFVRNIYYWLLSIGDQIDLKCILRSYDCSGIIRKK